MLVHARTGLQKEVMEQVCDEVAGGEDVIAAPKVAHGVHHLVSAAPDDRVMGVTKIRGCLERGINWLAFGNGAFKHQVDGGGDQFDMAKLLGGNGGDQIVEGLQLLLLLEAEGLVQIVVQGGHLPKLASKQFLDGGCSIRVWFGGLFKGNQELFRTEEHGCLSLSIRGSSM